MDSTFIALNVSENVTYHLRVTPEYYIMGISYVGLPSPTVTAVYPETSTSSARMADMDGSCEYHSSSQEISSLVTCRFHFRNIKTKRMMEHVWLDVVPMVSTGYTALAILRQELLNVTDACILNQLIKCTVKILIYPVIM